jgi:SAM-dependent methyltransferase
MELVKNKYKQAYKRYGKSKKSLFWPKGRQKERFSLLTQFIRKDNFSILDFGCGFGDLKKFLDINFDNFDYLGVDIVEEFIEENKKYDEKSFMLIKDEKDLPKKQFDYICISGTFNISYYNDIDKHEKKVKNILKYLFDNHLKADGILSVDFMHDEVDYISGNAFHINIPKFYDFFVKNLSKRLVINKHIFCYEVTFNIFKNIKKNEVNLWKDYNVFI